MIFRVLVMLMMALVFAHGEELPVIGFEDAAAHVGERVCVEGMITDVGFGPKGSVFLNFGGIYPEHAFTALVPFPLARKSDESSWRAYLDRVVRVSGVVKLYKDKPQIVVTAPEHLAIMKRKRRRG